MPEFRQQFIDSSVENLEILRQKILSAKEFSDTFLQEVFRLIHTVKGTAQTFDLETSSRIAHELEDFLADVKNGQSEFSKELLVESVAALKESFDENDAENADVLIEKIKNAASENRSVKILPKLPENILDCLSRPEIETLSAAFGNGKIIYCFEHYFSLTDFRGKLLRCREALERQGEIIATLSAEKRVEKIGFRFLFAGENDIQVFTQTFSPKIIFEISPINNQLLEVLKEVTAHGKKIAERLNKKIEFEICVDEIFFSSDQIKVIFDTLLHLIRNAADHAIETPAERVEKGKNETGKIEIRFQRETANLKITVSDDGRGIDLEKIKQKAIENKLLAENEDFDETKISYLIFLSGISTAENATEISGRGVGLDAVKNEIENAGGTIKVENRKEFGTKFEILLSANI